MKHSQTERVGDAINKYILWRAFRKQTFYFELLVVATLWCYVPGCSYVKITDLKCGLLQNTCLEKSSVTKLSVTINLYKKQCHPVIKRNKHHSSKQVVSMVHTLEKNFWDGWKACDTFLFRQSKIFCSILWSIWVFSAFLGKRESNSYCLKQNLVFHTLFFI